MTDIENEAPRILRRRAFKLNDNAVSHSFYLDRKTLSRISEIANERNMSRSALVDELLQEGLKRLLAKEEKEKEGHGRTI